MSMEVRFRRNGNECIETLANEAVPDILKKDGFSRIDLTRYSVLYMSASVKWAEKALDEKKIPVIYDSKRGFVGPVLLLPPGFDPSKVIHERND